MDNLESTYFYHIYNRGNNKENIFLEADNYFHFLHLIKKHILPIADIYCYCLLKNHFHLLLYIKDKAEKPSQAFSNLFNAYTKAFNKKYNRVGSLFQKPFKRIRVTNEDYLRQLVVYIHLNPENHELVDNFTEYLYSSYNSLLSAKPTNLKRDEVIKMFDDVKNFTEFHNLNRTLGEDSELKLE